MISRCSKTPRFLKGIVAASILVSVGVRGASAAGDSLTVEAMRASFQKARHQSGIAYSIASGDTSREDAEIEEQRLMIASRCPKANISGATMTFTCALRPEDLNGYVTQKLILASYTIAVQMFRKDPDLDSVSMSLTSSLLQQKHHPMALLSYTLGRQGILHHDFSHPFITDLHVTGAANPLKLNTSAQARIVLGSIPGGDGYEHILTGENGKWHETRILMAPAPIMRNGKVLKPSPLPAHYSIIMTRVGVAPNTTSTSPAPVSPPYNPPTVTLNKTHRARKHPSGQTNTSGAQIQQAPKSEPPKPDLAPQSALKPKANQAAIDKALSAITDSPAL